MPRGLSLSQSIQRSKEEIFGRFVEKLQGRQVIALAHVRGILDGLASFLKADEKGRDATVTFGELKSSTVPLDDRVEQYHVLFDALFEVLGAEGGLSLFDYKRMWSYQTRLLIADARSSDEEARQERELRERFVLTLAHDLRNPLTAIRTNSQLIGRFSDKVDRVVSLASRITLATDRLDRMVSNLLDANVVSAGRPIALETTPLDLVELVHNCVADYAVTFGDRFEIQGADEPMCGVWDRDGLVRVFENLLTNALKYGARGEKIRIAILRHEDAVEIAVNNRGNPLSPEDQSSLFSFFSRAKGSSTSKHKGWGIGLTVVKGIVEAHQGTVALSSRLEEGTTFTIRLPWVIQQ